MRNENLLRLIKGCSILLNTQLKKKKKYTAGKLITLKTNSVNPNT